MDEIIEQLAEKFTAEFKKNSNVRIEGFLEANALPDNLSDDEVVEVYRELIALEIDMRFQARQRIDRYDYKTRFPEYDSLVDEAVDRVFNLSVEQAADLSVDGSEATHIFEAEAEADQIVHDKNAIQTKKGPLLVPSSLGKYRNIEVVGRGTFGVVCKALDSESGETRALKFPRPLSGIFDQFVDLLQKETDKALPLNHANIVKTFGLEEVDEFVFVVQQFVQGSDLKETLNKDRTLKQKVELVAKIADALTYAHRLQIVHCDLKPANVLMDEKDNPYITDFGLAFHENEQLDMPNQQCGSPAYMSPQLVKGLIRDADGRTDIFSLGVILYELLTARRPFRGHTRGEIYRQIEDKDPTTPRNYNSKVDRELERICLKCLEKPARDRYGTAQDLADDLRYWISKDKQDDPVPGPPINQPEIKLKGLRPYGPEDSEFFLELLPGPRVRESFPESIHFWTRRICEPVDTDERVPVGFLLGPSGSGKSSFIRAGLIPQLDDSIEPIYVESTAQDTEVRLMRALRRRFESIPKDLSLPDIFAGLSRGKWHEGEHAGKKLLIVLDQFEQRLSQNDTYRQSQIVKALEYCDGEHIQCILLCRDDFWMAATRFADALELDIREGENSQSIDLFDKPHARNVLVKFGQHLNKLDADESKFTKEQIAFLDRAVEQLARANHIICVRLTLFVEMFKHRDWTDNELQSVGGVAGVGEQFLESTFGQESDNKIRNHRKLVQSILETLLPESGRDIRGAMKTEEELLTASQSENKKQVFKEVLNILDRELKLITRTDPDSAGDISVAEGDTSTDVIYYQLTHDYLVPSIREWLNTELKNTRRGRALIRLRELAEQVIPGQKPKYLPSNLEWIQWFFLIRGEIRTPAEKTVFGHSCRKFCFFSSAIVASVGLITFIVLLARKEFNNQSLVTQIKATELSDITPVLKDVSTLGKGFANRLKEELDSETLSQAQLRRMQVALFVLGVESDSRLLNMLLDSNTTPHQLDSLTEVLQTYSDNENWKVRLRSVQLDSSLPPETRLRAFASLARSHEKTNWNGYAGTIVNALLNEPTIYHDKWISLLVPIKNHLMPVFERQFRFAAESSRAIFLAKAIHSFENHDKWLEFFVSIICDANTHQFRALLQTHGSANNDELLKIMDKELEDGLSDSQFVTKVIAELVLGREDRFIATLNGDFGNSKRSCAMVYANSGRVDFWKLRQLTSTNSFESLPRFRQGLLCVIATKVVAQNSDEDFIWASKLAQELCLTELESGCHSAAELILRLLANEGKTEIDYMDVRDKRRKNCEDENGILGSVFINSKNMAFAIIRPNENNGLAFPVAVSYTELSEKDFQFQFANQSSNSLLPKRIVGFHEVFDYCNWLSREEELSEFFPKDQQILGMKIDVERLGYRCLFQNELDAVYGKTLDHFGQQREFAQHFAWMSENSNGKLHPGGLKLPNEFGLYDLFGNLFESFVLLDRAENDYKISKCKIIGSSIGFDRTLFGKLNRGVYDPKKVFQEANAAIRICRRIELKSQN